MFVNQLPNLIVSSLLTFNIFMASPQPLATAFTALPTVFPSQQPTVLSAHQISLEDRQPDKYVNQVFKDNILLNIKYMQGNVNRTSLNWDEIRKPFNYNLKLYPNETFAFQDNILEQYKNKPVKTITAHFNSADGFESDGYLYGDGVCHLASLMNWVAKDAKLEVYAPTNHNFADISGISKENGVAIFSDPYNKQVGANENLYITNNTGKLVTFRFESNGANLKLTVLEDN